MGPLLLLLSNNWRRLIESRGHRPEKPPQKGRMSLIHVMALKGLRKGCIRTTEPGVVVLKKGVEGLGRRLHQARFRPGVLKSWRNAKSICQEVARRRHKFDILFIDNTPLPDGVSVLCPQCETYWNWDEKLPNNLRKESGRLCTACHGEHSGPAL